ncbi:plasma membrane intrinsic protein 2 [Striga asiatica]|uniref:Plasma membrane intrinsic protein 2 n=1 Tax=Striga asiatica TaxID=4170 RepID=A0A5A7PM29_STRAF|nr:plasma membrane intrinsic protein 2 [Striga asiatica]
MVTRRVFLSHHPTPPPPAGSSPITSSQRKKKKNRKSKPARRLVSAVSTPNLRQQARIFVSVRQRIGRRKRGRATAEGEICGEAGLWADGGQFFTVAGLLAKELPGQVADGAEMLVVMISIDAHLQSSISAAAFLQICHSRRHRRRRLPLDPPFPPPSSSRSSIPAAIFVLIVPDRRQSIVAPASDLRPEYLSGGDRLCFVARRRRHLRRPRRSPSPASPLSPSPSSVDRAVIRRPRLTTSSTLAGVMSVRRPRRRRTPRHRTPCRFSPPPRLTRIRHQIRLRPHLSRRHIEPPASGSVPINFPLEFSFLRCPVWSLDRLPISYGILESYLVTYSDSGGDRVGDGGARRREPFEDQEKKKKRGRGRVPLPEKSSAMKRQQATVRCSVCSVEGHNKRRCARSGANSKAKLPQKSQRDEVPEMDEEMTGFDDIFSQLTKFKQSQATATNVNLSYPASLVGGHFIPSVERCISKQSMSARPIFHDEMNKYVNFNDLSVAVEESKKKLGNKKL